MENIIEPTLDYNFNLLQLGLPITQPGSTYLTRIFMNSKPLYIQTPKCITRSGFIKSGKKIYCDLMFTNDDTIFINWMENLENKCQELIYEKGEAWFQTAMEKTDIEHAFTSPFKIYKSGKYYLLRVNVKPVIKIYNDLNNEITFENVTPEMNLISILEIQGIKFTSRNFQIEFELKQTMVVSPDPFLEECFIRKSNPSLKKQYEPIITSQSVIEKTQDGSDNQTDISQLVNNVLEQKNESTNDVTTETSETIVTMNDVENNTSPNNIILAHVEETNNENKSIENSTIETTQPNSLDEMNELSEFDLNVSLDNLETITLKRPKHAYYQLYRETKDKAKKAKLEAKTAYLEAKTIKEKYMLDTDSDSDSYGDDNSYSNSENEEFSDNENIFATNS